MNAGCKKDSESSLFARGQTVYMSRCIACHNVDPKQDGALGPAVFGASKDLIEARVLRMEYPSGYLPKRTTKLMTAMPDLVADIPALQAYLSGQVK